MALALLALAWCVAVGSWIWVTPVRFVGFSDGVPAVHERAFSDVSPLGPVLLLIPTGLVALGCWAAWCGHARVLAVAAGLLCAFTMLAGFSIGQGYVPAAVLLVVAAWTTCRPLESRRA